PGGRAAARRPGPHPHHSRRGRSRRQRRGRHPPRPRPERAPHDPPGAREPAVAQPPASADRHPDRLAGILPPARHAAPARTPLRGPGPGATPPVAVINQAAAATYWPHQDPLGKRVHLLGRLGRQQPGWTTIVGIIANARTESLADAGMPQMYLDIYQRPFKFLAFYLRGKVDPAAIADQARAQIQTVDPQLPVSPAEALNDVLSASLSVRRFSLELVAIFAAIALLLAALGIYGTISFLVGEQSREIAIRLALGASRGTILG